jgi:hypothetical protein
MAWLEKTGAAAVLLEVAVAVRGNTPAKEALAARVTGRTAQEGKATVQAARVNGQTAQVGKAMGPVGKEAEREATAAGGAARPATPRANLRRVLRAMILSIRGRRR